MLKILHLALMHLLPGNFGVPSISLMFRGCHYARIIALTNKYLPADRLP